MDKATLIIYCLQWSFFILSLLLKYLSYVDKDCDDKWGVKMYQFLIFLILQLIPGIGLIASLYVFLFIIQLHIRKELFFKKYIKIKSKRWSNFKKECKIFFNKIV